MKYMISFTEFIDNAWKGMGKLDTWSRSVAEELNVNFGSNAHKLSVWLKKLRLALSQARNESIPREAFLQRMEKLRENSKILYDENMPEYMSSAISCMVLQIFSDLDSMWVHCKVSNLILEAVKNIEAIIDLIESGFETGEIVETGPFTPCKNVLSFLQLHFTAGLHLAKITDRNVLEELVSEISCFRVPANGPSPYIVKKLSGGMGDMCETLIHGTCLAGFRLVELWYGRAIDAAKFKPQDAGADAKRNVAAIKANANALTYLELTYHALNDIADILGNYGLRAVKAMTRHQQANNVRLQLISDITGILFKINLLRNARFAFAENRNIFNWIMSSIVDGNAGSLRIDERIDDLKSLTGDNDQVYRELLCPIPFAKSYLEKADRAISRIFKDK